MDYFEATLSCDSCGIEVTLAQCLPEALSEVYAGATYEAMKEGCDPPIGMCPNCDENAYSLREDTCLLCGMGRPYTNCIRCSSPLTLDEQDQGGVCGYCHHVATRDD